MWLADHGMIVNVRLKASGWNNGATMVEFITWQIEERDGVDARCLCDRVLRNGRWERLQ